MKADLVILGKRWPWAGQQPSAFQFNEAGSRVVPGCLVFPRLSRTNF